MTDQNKASSANSQDWLKATEGLTIVAYLEDDGRFKPTIIKKDLIKTTPAVSAKSNVLPNEMRRIDNPD